MIVSLPNITKAIKTKIYTYRSEAPSNSLDTFVMNEKKWSLVTGILSSIALLLVFALSTKSVQKLVIPIITPLQELRPLTQGKKGSEVFGFAPYWTIDKLDNVDFTTLTTLSYFGAPVDEAGNIDREDPGYVTFMSKKATDIFRKAHSYGTRVVLTITQMDNATIEQFLSDPSAEQNAIDQTVTEVKKRGIDGVNVDFEYLGSPDTGMRNSFTKFVTDLTTTMHGQMPESKVTVSVYALSARDQKLYDIKALGANADGIFMMAYDFAVAGSDNAIPTAPLHGYKQGRYMYDVATAVDDFLALMPANKLILGVPYYGYNYLVYQPNVNAETRPYYSWRGTPTVQTYAVAEANVTPTMDGIDAYKTGWDPVGQVGWKAYHVAATDTWRMIFLEDTKSLGIKYDFAKSKNLAGVGIWALGFDDGKPELWALLREKFGEKLADNRIVSKQIAEENE